MTKEFWMILAISIVAFVGLFLLAGGKDSGGESTATPIENPFELQEQDHKKGKKTEVTIIEYGDFQCPGCGALFPVIKQVEAKYGDDITFAFRHFPLTNIHPQAMAAHRAAEAASNQDKFWEMHDILYARQQDWSGNSNASAIFEDYANDLALDLEQFKADVASQETFDRIDVDTDSGSDAGVVSTPTLIVNGEKLEEIPRDLDGFSELIDGLLEEAGVSTDAEEPAEEAN